MHALSTHLGVQTGSHFPLTATTIPQALTRPKHTNQHAKTKHQPD